MTRAFAPRPRQAAVIPVCRTSAGDIEMCLIRRREAAAWGVPKGFLDPGDTADEAALREAYEEAGVSGRLVGGQLGSYDYWKRGSQYTVAVFLMEVLEEERTWPEMRLRVRKWCALDEAIALLADHPVRPLLDDVRERISKGHL